MRNYITILISIFLVFFGTSIIAQEKAMSSSEIATFKQKVMEEAKSTRSIQTNFIQYKHLDFLSNDVKTSGKMLFKAPHLVKWEYTHPYQYSVVFKEDQLLINDGGSKSKVDIGNSKLFRKLNQLIVNSMTGDMFDDTDFEVSFLTSSKYNKAIFVSKDKKIAEFIASFELLFDRKDAQVLEVKMIEPSQDFTRIVFENRLINTKVDDSVFTN